MAETAGENPDPHKSTHICLVGKKHTGKTELAYVLFDSYPFDRLAVDPPGDLKMPEDTVQLDPLPHRWPGTTVESVTGERRRERTTLHYVPNFHSPTYRQDMDQACGLAYGHGRCCLLFDEVHEGAPANQVPPHMRRVLRQARHRALTTIFATQRPLTVDPLVISQADYLYVFKLPNPNDRKRVAETIGWTQKSFDEAVGGLGNYEYLRYDAGANAGEGDLAHFPALPEERIAHHAPS